MKIKTEKRRVYYFWIVYGLLETLNDNGKVINHKQLHEALVSSGRFYGGEATQVISDMVKEGRLEEISFETYKRR